MIAEAKAFWDSISGKVKSLIRKETENALRMQRYDVTTAPNGTVMGVTQPFGSNEIFLPYSKEVASATVGDTVLVAWWGSMSNARVYYFAKGYDGGGGTSVLPYDSNPEPLGTAAPGDSDYFSRGNHVHAMPSAADVGALASSTTAASIGGMSKWEKLWENASPASSFAAQTVPLDMSGYDACAVYVAESNSAGSTGQWFFYVKNQPSDSRAFLMYNARQLRYFYIVSTGVYFTGGYVGTFPSGALSANDAYAIPRLIYGIKGVINA